jgi:hypothetical protein
LNVQATSNQRVARWAAALVGGAGAVLLALAWRDALAGYESALRLVGAYSETGGLRWDAPPWVWDARYWYAWLTFMTTGHVVVATVGSLTMLGAAMLAPTRRSDATQWARISVICVVALVGGLLLLGEPAMVLRVGHDGLARTYWTVHPTLTAAEVDAWRVCASAVLFAWVAAMAAAMRAPTPRVAWTAALILLAAGSGACVGVRPLARIVAVPDGEYPLGRDDRLLPRTPRGANEAGRWVGTCTRDLLCSARIACDSPPAAYGFDFAVTSWSDYTIHHPTQPFPPGALVARASASLAPLRWYLDRFRRYDVATVDAVTVRETRVSHTPMFGEVHLGTWTVVALPIACLDALADNVRWGDAVARCGGSQAGRGPSL